ncbi:MAG: RNA recognition motif domain-containing protein [Patescibacteria group bacterium]
MGNLAYGVTDEDLGSAFAASGTVASAKVITDRVTGRSRGFGFVEMSTDEEAQAAIQAMDGQDIGGRPVKVNEARPQTDRPRGNFSDR